MTMTMRQTKEQDNLLVVLGATGNQGGAVLKWFVRNPDQSHIRLRGVTRNPDSKSSKLLQDLGIQMVQGDLDDLGSLKKAFSGATHIFATTDSNRLIFDAIKNPHFLKEGETPRSYARDIELQLGRNVAQAAASISSLQRFIWSSLPSPKKWSNGKYSQVTMFDTKEDIADIFAQTPGVKDKLSAVLIGFYATNALAMPTLYAPHKRDDGVYELALPMSGDVTVPIADLDADLGAWTSALMKAEPGVILLGTTQNKSWKEWLHLWADRNGVTAEYRKAGQEEYAAKIEGISEAVLEEFAFIEEFGFTGGDPRVIQPQDLQAPGVTLSSSTIEEHIRKTDWSSIL